MAGEGEAGFLILGLGWFLVCLFFCWLLYQLTRSLKSTADKEEKYDCLEIGILRQIAEGMGIDLEFEKLKNEIFKPVKSIRKQMEQEILKRFMNHIDKTKDEPKDKQTTLNNFKDKET